MNEKDCSDIATKYILSTYTFTKYISFDREIANDKGTRPDRLILIKHDFITNIFADEKYHLHAVESKARREHFRGLNDRNFPDPVRQIQDYHGKYRWLAVANKILTLSEWEILKDHCEREGIGLIVCKGRGDPEIVLEASASAGRPWLRYPRILKNMEYVKWHVH